VNPQQPVVPPTRPRRRVWPWLVFGIPGGLLALVIVIAIATPSGREGFGAGWSAAQSPPATSTPITSGAAHHVVYQFGLTGQLHGDDWTKIGLGWNNPSTGKPETPPETRANSTKPLVFPYAVTFDVDTLALDGQHVSAGAIVDTAGIVVSCTIIVDGKVVAADPGTPAVMLPNGTPDRGGSSTCIPRP